VRALRLYVRLVDRLSTAVGLLAAGLMPVMVLVLFYEVVSRYVFSAPTIWAFDTSIFLFGYLGLLAGAYALRLDEHIRVDIFSSQLRPRGRAVLELLTAPLVVFFLLLVVIYAGEAALDALVRGTRRPTDWAPPVGHLMAMIPTGAALLLLQATANWVRAGYLVVTGRELDA
jgi:TRAP-type C4-dicarboxylate transport system permease small subunit